MQRCQGAPSRSAAVKHRLPKAARARREPTRGPQILARGILIIRPRKPQARLSPGRGRDLVTSWSSSSPTSSTASQLSRAVLGYSCTSRPSEGLRSVSRPSGCLCRRAFGRRGSLANKTQPTMESARRAPADDWHGGDSTDVLDAEDEAAYIAGTRTRLEGVPRRPDSQS